MTKPTVPRNSQSRWRRGLFVALSVVVFLVAAQVLFHEFRLLNWSAVAAAVHQWGQRFQLAVLLCCLSFATVGLIEWRALR